MLLLFLTVKAAHLFFSVIISIFSGIYNIFSFEGKVSFRECLKEGRKQEKFDWFFQIPPGERQ